MNENTNLFYFINKWIIVIFSNIMMIVDSVVNAICIEYNYLATKRDMPFVALYNNYKRLLVKSITLPMCLCLYICILYIILFATTMTQFNILND